MRRPVGVKWILLFFCWQGFFSGRVSHCRHPSIRTLVSDFVRSVQVGRSRFSRCCHLIIDLSSISTMEVGQAIDAVTGTRLWLLSFLFLGTVLFLRGRGYCRWAAVVQRIVYFSAHPQMMQQHRQLSRSRHDGSLLAVSSPTFC